VLKMNDEEVVWCDSCDKQVSGEKLAHCRYLCHELLDLPKENQEERGKRKEEHENISEKIYQFAKTKIKKLVVAEHDSSQAYALIENKDHIETLDLSSGRAKSWLRYSYYKETGKNHSEDAYAIALLLIKAETIHSDTPRERIYNRIAMVGDAIYYDLVTPDWKAVKITKDSVNVIELDESCPVFTRTQNQKEQVMPKFGLQNALEDFTALLRISQKNKQMFMVHLVSMFIEPYPIPIMSIVGEHGTIKSTISKSVKQIVDPSGAKTISLSNNSENLVLSLHNRYAVCFDNVSKIDQATSDILCKAVTGDGNAKRKLYTDSDEIIYSYKRKIILNGISPNLEFPDLVDRNITYETQKISEEQRITEESFEQKFNELLPYIMGQIFQTISKAMGIYDSVKSELKHLPRMADFTIWGECIARTLGYQSFSFSNNYKDRIKSHSLEMLESYPIIGIVEDLLKESEHYEDTIQNFYNTIKARAESDGVDVNSRDVNFPRAANKVREHIQKLKPDFRSMGMEIDIAPYTKRDGRHPKNRQVIYIDKIKSTIAQYGAEESLPSGPPLPEKFYERIRESGGSYTGRDELIKPVLSLPYLAKFTPKGLNGKDGNHGIDKSDNLREA